MSETRFFWVKCWALEILGIARAAIARTTESFAYFERHDMDCIPSRRSFQSARQLERDKLLGWFMARVHWAWHYCAGRCGGRWKSSAWGRGECHKKVKTESLSRRGEGEPVYSREIHRGTRTLGVRLRAQQGP